MFHSDIRNEEASDPKYLSIQVRRKPASGLIEHGIAVQNWRKDLSTLNQRALEMKDKRVRRIWTESHHFNEKTTLTKFVVDMKKFVDSQSS